MRSHFFISFLLPALCFAGQSLVITPGLQNSSINLPTFSDNESWRVEFQVHNFSLPAPGNFSATLFSLNGLGLQTWIFPNNQIAMGDVRDTTSGGGQPCELDLTGRTNVLIRVQRDVLNKLFTCEIWNYDGTGYQTRSQVIISANSWSQDGGSLGGGATGDLAFLRIFKNLMAVNSKPPTTADIGNYLELSFDKTLKDLSRRGHNSDLTKPTYVNTPNQGPSAVPKTRGAPTWSNWTSLRAGYPAQLDGSASYSLADGSSLVSFSWQQLSGPTSVVWTDRNVAIPTISGLVFGTYTFQLTVTDVEGNSATTKLQIGAVAYDENGVVIPPNAKVTQVFGPMIAFGRNPWGFADQRHLAATLLQGSAGGALYDYAAKATWTTSGSGTVSYPFSGKGPAPGAKCTTLTEPLTSTSVKIAVADASCLSLDSLPTVILIGNNFSAFGGGAQEMVRICSASATTGPAILATCYDGRGLAGRSGLTGFSSPPPAQAWPSGTVVGEYRISGTGTKFITDTTRPLCPAGVSGPPGTVVYASGSVQLAANSTTITGIGTQWRMPDVFGGDSLMIRINATHGGGLPFVSVGSIKTVGSTTSITMSRPAPSDVDTRTNFTYAITSPRYVSLDVRDPTGNIVHMLQNLEWCESETAAFAIAAHDVPAMDGLMFSGMHYSYKDSLGAQSSFGPNFYGSGLALRYFYYRSGWVPALTAANLIDEIWVSDPELCNGWCGGMPLNQGGGAVGAIVDLATNPSTSLTWPSVRQFGITSTALGAAGCNAFDSRDSGVLSSYASLLALFDPDPTYHAIWQSTLSALHERETRTINPITGQPCKGDDNSWAHGFLWNPGGPALNLTSGSPTVTAPHSDFAPTICNGIASGIATINAGSATVTAQMGAFVSGAAIVLTGIKKGEIYTLRTSFVLNSSKAITLGGLWAGDDGTVKWIITSDANWSTIATSNDDPNLKDNWSCIYNSPTQITLNRPWNHASNTSGSNHMYTSNLAGFGQQGFMLGGWKESAFRWASLNSDPLIASSFSALTKLVAQWIHDVGYDPQTQGITYGRVFQSCEPAILSSTAAVEYKSAGCQFGSAPDTGIRASRAINGETTNAVSIYYLNHPTPIAQRYGDIAYGSIWGFCPFTKSGYYCDANYVRDENSDTSLAGYKWPGFFFGIGFAEQWPAIRVGGPQQPKTETQSISFSLGNATRALILLMTSSGASASVNCPASPCPVIVDRNQGSLWFTIQYLSESSVVLSQSAPKLLDFTP